METHRQYSKIFDTFDTKKFLGMGFGGMEGFYGVYDTNILKSYI
jgi:hypothetical protein